MSARPGGLYGRLFDGAVLLAVAGLALCTVLSFLSERLWIGELAVHFRVQYLALALVGAALAALRGSWLLVACAMAVAAPNAWFATPYLTGNGGNVARGAEATNRAAGGLSLVELNLLYRNREFEQVREYLLSRSPDLLVLTELTADWVRELQPVTAHYPFWLALPRETPWGLGVYSRYPLDEARFVDLGAQASVNVSAVLRGPGGPVRFYAVHLASPTSVRATRQRNEQLKALAGLVSVARADASASPPRIVVGDLNVTPFSPQFSGFLQRTGLTDARRGRGWQATWPAGIAPLRIPIDHCLVDSAVRVTGVTRGPFVGSDHLPVEVNLQLPGNSAGQVLRARP